jgi:hypothetical protein
LATRTKIPAEAILMFVIATVVTLGLALYLAVLLLCLQRMRGREALRYKLMVDNTPNGLLDWIRQAVITTGEVEPGITHSSLKNWTLTPSYNYQYLQLSRKGGEPEYRPMIVQSLDHNAIDNQNSNLCLFSPVQHPSGAGSVDTPQSTPGATHGKWESPGPQQSNVPKPLGANIVPEATHSVGKGAV